MKSIEDLRDYIHYHGDDYLCERDMMALVDEVEREIEEMRDFYDRVENATRNQSDLDLFGIGYTALPGDANGAPIHVGDTFETRTGKRDIVRFLTVNSSGWVVNESGWYPDALRTCGTDSWVKIIRDALDFAPTDSSYSTKLAKLVGRCKLLAGDE